jgi:TatD DNase family protein
MKPEYIDTHAHLYFDEYDEDRSDVIKRCEDNKVAVINIGTDLESSKKVLELAEQNKNFYGVIGFHPVYVKDSSSKDFKEFEKLIKHPKCVGIGECGLDYFRDEDKEVAEMQKEFFIRQIGLALDYDKPLVIHCRDARSSGGQAWREVLDILKVYKEVHPELKVNFHFFNQDPALAKEILELGFQFSFTGVITFAKELEEVVKFAPLDKIMSETDSPFVAPKNNRGKRNEPSYVIEVVEKIAELKELEVEKVKKQLMSNAEEFFGL